jgi:hypothetical protein
MLDTDLHHVADVSSAQAVNIGANKVTILEERDHLVRGRLDCQSRRQSKADVAASQGISVQPLEPLAQGR